LAATDEMLYQKGGGTDNIDQSLQNMQLEQELRQ